MPLAIVPYTPEFEAGVTAFNARLRESGVRFQFPERAPARQPEHAPILTRGYVAVRDGQSVHGGYLIKDQQFRLSGRDLRLGYVRLPLSEGLIDRRYTTLGVQLIAHALKHHPPLFGLGIGGADEPFARLVSALGWTLKPVPFLFKVVHPFRVARHLRPLRRTPLRRWLADAAAWTGLAWVGAKAAHARPLHGGTTPAQGGAFDAVGNFDAVGDEVWRAHRDGVHLVAQRDSAALASMYSPDDRPYLRFVHRSSAGSTAWCVALDTQMSGDKYFGDLRVATIVDAFGGASDAVALMSKVTRALAGRGVDIILTNQSSEIWTSALRRLGFLTQPSNFLFAASPALVNALGSVGDLGAFHLTRGDGDGPINL